LLERRGKIDEGKDDATPLKKGDGRCLIGYSTNSHGYHIKKQSRRKRWEREEGAGSHSCEVPSFQDPVAAKLANHVGSTKRFGLERVSELEKRGKMS